MPFTEEDVKKVARDYFGYGATRESRKALLKPVFEVKGEDRITCHSPGGHSSYRTYLGDKKTIVSGSKADSFLAAFNASILSAASASLTASNSSTTKQTEDSSQMLHVCEINWEDRKTVSWIKPKDREILDDAHMGAGYVDTVDVVVGFTISFRFVMSSEMREKLSEVVRKGEFKADSTLPSTLFNLSASGENKQSQTGNTKQSQQGLYVNCIARGFVWHALTHLVFDIQGLQKLVGELTENATKGSGRVKISHLTSYAMPERWLELHKVVYGEQINAFTLSLALEQSLLRLKSTINRHAVQSQVIDHAQDDANYQAYSSKLWELMSAILNNGSLTYGEEYPKILKINGQYVGIKFDFSVTGNNLPCLVLTKNRDEATEFYLKIKPRHESRVAGEVNICFYAPNGVSYAVCSGLDRACRPLLCGTSSSELSAAANHSDAEHFIWMVKRLNKTQGIEFTSVSDGQEYVWSVLAGTLGFAFREAGACTISLEETGAIYRDLKSLIPASILAQNPQIAVPEHIPEKSPATLELENEIRSATGKVYVGAYKLAREHREVDQDRQYYRNSRYYQFVDKLTDVFPLTPLYMVLHPVAFRATVDHMLRLTMRRAELEKAVEKLHVLHARLLTTTPRARL